MARQVIAGVGLSGAARERTAESQRFAARVGPFVGASHLAFFALFTYLAVWPLAATYFLCVLFSVWVGHATRCRPDRLDTLLGWSWVVIFAQSLVAVWVLGPGAGFQFYLLATIPAGFARIDRPLSLKLLQAGLVVAFFLVCDSWLVRYAVPLYPYSEPVLATLRHLNTVGSCAMLAGSAYVQALVIKESRDTLQRIAGTDALTGLFNRRSFAEIAEREQARCRRNARPLALILGDIDHFKRINDRNGHAAGDHVLQSVARLLPTALREYDCVARWGGEEFIVLLPDTDLAHALIIAERLRVSVAAGGSQFAGETIAVTMTLGVACPAADEDWLAAVSRADEALYRGKHGGRNRVESA